MQTISWLCQEIRGLYNYLLPPACASCLEPLSPPDPDSFCATCIDRIPGIQEPCCPVCVLPYPSDSANGHHCQSCLQEKKASFAGVIALGQHQDLLREAIHRFKYRNDINLDRPLGQMLTRKIILSGHEFDLIVPVPLHKGKLYKRGYNQSALIARQISRILKLPLASNLLRRIDPGATQKEMAGRDRAKNVRGAFACTQQLQKTRMLLVDDVMTTGSTARECSRTLLAAGAASVHVAILSRAPLA